MTKPYIPTQPWNSDCTLCKEPMAYQGFYSCECTSSTCKNYSGAYAKSVNEYVDYLDKVAKAKEAEERKKKDFINAYMPTSYIPDTRESLEEENEMHRLAYGNYALQHVPDAKDNSNNTGYDPTGFYSSGCLDNDPSDDPADCQPIPVVSYDDDLLDLFGPIKF